MGNKTKLSECENMIMLILLKSDHDLNLTEITEQAKQLGKEWKLQTTATFVKRMERKGYVSIYKVGRYSHYRPEKKLGRLPEREALGNKRAAVIQG